MVETKTWSKLDSGKHVIEFYGDTLKRNGDVFQPSPTLQAITFSRYLSDLLLESTGKRFAVQPVVTFPGWWVDQSVLYTEGKPWVLNPKQISSFFNSLNDTLSLKMLTSLHII